VSTGIGLLCLLGGGVVLFAVAAFMRWLTMTLSGAKLGSVWDWFWTILDLLSSL
jgi:hypothetical protein